MKHSIDLQAFIDAILDSSNRVLRMIIEFAIGTITSAIWAIVKFESIPLLNELSKYFPLIKDIHNVFEDSLILIGMVMFVVFILEFIFSVNHSFGRV